MLGECLEIFGSYTEEERERLILEDYIPKDGTYILVGTDGEIREVTEFRLDKKSGEINRNASFFREFLYFDYHSDLISMNKPQDSEKIIHSNNYLSFWVKKESLEAVLYTMCSCLSSFYIPELIQIHLRVPVYHSTKCHSAPGLYSCRFNHFAYKSGRKSFVRSIDCASRHSSTFA